MELSIFTLTPEKPNPALLLKPGNCSLHRVEGMDTYPVQGKAGYYLRRELTGYGKTPILRPSGASRTPGVVPTKVGNHFKDWVTVFTENPGFRLPPE